MGGAVFRRERSWGRDMVRGDSVSPSQPGEAGACCVARRSQFSSASGPVLGAVIDVQDLNVAVFQAIDDDVGQARKDQLARPLLASWAAAEGSGAECKDRFVDFADRRLCERWEMPEKILMNRFQVISRSRGPAQPHQVLSIREMRASISASSTNIPRLA